MCHNSCDRKDNVRPPIGLLNGWLVSWSVRWSAFDQRVSKIVILLQNNHASVLYAAPLCPKLLVFLTPPDCWSVLPSWPTADTGLSPTSRLWNPLGIGPLGCGCCGNLGYVSLGCGVAPWEPAELFFAWCCIKSNKPATPSCYCIK